MRRPSLPTSFVALRHSRFRAVWLALVTSMLGFWLQATARAFLVYEATGSPAALGLVYLASYAPQLLVGPWAGVLADRCDRRRLVVLATAAMVLNALVTALLAGTGHAGVTAVVAVSLVGGVLLTLQSTAALALLPDLVPRAALSSAVSLQAMCVSGTRVVGPLLAGALLPLTGPAWLFVGQAVTLVPVAVVWARLALPARPAAPPAAADRGLRGLTAGLRHVARAPELRVPLSLLAVLTAVGYVHQPLALAYATEALSAGDPELGVQRFGLLQGAVGLGALLGVAAVGSTRRPALVVLGTGAVLSLSLAGLGLTSTVPVAVAVAALLGAAQFANTNVAHVLAQHHAPAHLRGRVMALTQMATAGLFPFTAFVLGGAAELVGTSRLYVGCGLVCLVAVLVAVPARRHLRLPAGDEDAGTPAAALPPSGAGGAVPPQREDPLSSAARR